MPSQSLVTCPTRLTNIGELHCNSTGRGGSRVQPRRAGDPPHDCWKSHRISSTNGYDPATVLISGGIRAFRARGSCCPSESRIVKTFPRQREGREGGEGLQILHRLHHAAPTTPGLITFMVLEDKHQTPYANNSNEKTSQQHSYKVVRSDVHAKSTNQPTEHSNASTSSKSSKITSILPNHGSIFGKTCFLPRRSRMRGQFGRHAQQPKG